jgi:hypothetical protein
LDQAFLRGGRDLVSSFCDLRRELRVHFSHPNTASPRLEKTANPFPADFSEPAGRLRKKVVPNKSPSDVTYKFLIGVYCTIARHLWEVIDTEGRLEQGGRSIRASRSTGDGVDFRVWP